MVEHIISIISGAQTLILTTARNITTHSGQILIDRDEIQMLGIAVAGLGSIGTGILSCQHNLTELLVGTVRSCIVPQVGIVSCQRMSIDDLGGILDDIVKVGGLGSRVPAVVQL